jgi:hypothetical protein
MFETRRFGPEGDGTEKVALSGRRLDSAKPGRSTGDDERKTDHALIPDELGF